MSVELAGFGGKPVRSTRIYYGHQSIDERDISSVVDVLKSDYITCGPMVQKTEEKLRKITGAEYAVLVSSGTAALHLACIAAGIGPGDEVITTPLTFAASANCVLYCGGTPVFADVDPDTYNIDPKDVEKKITDRTKAIIAVDFTGQVVQIRELREIADRYSLVLIEDAAHSIGSRYEGKPVGSLADITCFSFHPVKTVTAGEGGAVLTNREDFYRRICLGRSHGIAHSNEEMVNPTGETWYYEQIFLGFNYRMTDFQAALLFSQLDKLSWFKKRRNEIASRYDLAFSKTDSLIVQKVIPESDTCRHLYIIRLNMDHLTCTRKEFFDAMSAENVQCQVHYIPVYWFPYYERKGYKKGLCPKAEEIYQTIMSIPLYPSMGDKDVDDVINAVVKIVNYYRR
ncbi:MAG: UDP-4-amino-4,6-dideoxy-N-acetyl-beta-L-altrosamine transaminase [Eubacterium sp.]|nr:UDP-4-amino-4,6-dideoxy-N-acetyl-beta-L-altrosamine transaminase [Eubacterium sp.]